MSAIEDGRAVVALLASLGVPGGMVRVDAAGVVSVGVPLVPGLMVVLKRAALSVRCEECGGGAGVECAEYVEGGSWDYVSPHGVRVERMREGL